MFTTKEIKILRRNGFSLNSENTVATNSANKYYITFNTIPTYRGFILHAPNNWSYGCSTVCEAINLMNQDVKYHK